MNLKEIKAFLKIIINLYESNYANNIDNKYDILNRAKHLLNKDYIFINEYLAFLSSITS